MIDAGLPVRAFFTTRDGGVSVPPYESLNLAVHVGDEPHAVATNRARVADHAGVPVSYLVAEHGIAVARLTAPGESPPAADALVTTVPGVGLAAIAADCVPVLLHDSASGAVAAVHAGREGLFAGVIDATVAALLDIRGGHRARGQMRASIGPAICGRCYEVPVAMRARVAARHASAFATTRTGTAALDLPRAIETRLGELGLSGIVRSHECTAESSRLFSHRRDGVTGRFAGIVVCE
ncbi:peptidoglycan editing factor PgeF [Demequina aestuarii]|uniref:peptidoglycan editing factor PgeF n=1 Tax=Demequina aestuarii TaxID=327095 RepID=UPI000A6B23BD|nr:peptidoglycan editing factor PgeF [Demequina aestuarii]